MTFDPLTRKLLDTTRTIEIETTSPKGTVHRVPIWIVVDGDEAFVRSVRGARGRWYREIVGNPRGALHVGGRRVPVTAQSANDAATVARVSELLSRKYQDRWPGPTAAMLREEVLPTTLRLAPDTQPA